MFKETKFANILSQITSMGNVHPIAVLGHGSGDISLKYMELQLH